MVEGCTVVGGQQGIVVDSAGADIHGNRVSSTSYQAITMTEMSMGMIAENEVAGAVGAGIACVDQSMCMIEDNHVSGTKADPTTPGLERQAGYGIVSDYKAEAELADNELVGNAGAGRRLRRGRDQRGRLTRFIPGNASIPAVRGTCSAMAAIPDGIVLKRHRDLEGRRNHAGSGAR